MSDIKPFAFVLMPFSPDFKDIYKYGIKETAQKLGIVAERVDEQNFSETILERIYRQIDNSDFVIADMTGQNPNVFYEVGYAHAKSKTCALITQDATDIPFDLKHHVHLIYDGSVDDLKKRLEPKLIWLKEECERRKVETIGVDVKYSNWGHLQKEVWQHTGEFELILDLKNTSSQRSPELEAIYLRTQKDWLLSCEGKDCPSKAAVEKKSKRHFIKPPLHRLSPGAFSEVKIQFSKVLWSRYKGREPKNSYPAKGNLNCEIATSEGSYFFDFPIDIEFEEFPF